MAAFEMVVHEDGMTAELQHGLRDVVARVGGDALGELGLLILRRMGAHEHAVAAGFVHGLHDELVEVREDVVALLRVDAEVGGHVRQDGVLIEVVFDHLRHERVNGFVVRHAGADRVREGDVALLVGADDAGHAEERVFAENERIEEVVVDAAVDHVHLLEAGGGAHEDTAIFEQQIATFDDGHAHLLREVAVLEVGAVVHAWREHDDVWINDAGRCEMGQGLAQHRAVGIHGTHG